MVVPKLRVEDQRFFMLRWPTTITWVEYKDAVVVHSLDDDKNDDNVVLMTGQADTQTD